MTFKETCGRRSSDDVTLWPLWLQSESRKYSQNSQRMETPVTAAELVVPPPSDGKAKKAEGEAGAPPSSADHPDPMEGFKRRLDDIISVYGSAAELLEQQVSVRHTPEGHICSGGLRVNLCSCPRV